MPKNRLILGANKALAVVEGHPDQTVEITDPDRLKEIRDLVEKRRQAGIELSRKLKDNGLRTASDDEDTVPV
jgi:hypothetical protein